VEGEMVEEEVNNLFFSFIRLINSGTTSWGQDRERKRARGV